MDFDEILYWLFHWDLFRNVESVCMKDLYDKTSL